MDVTQSLAVSGSGHGGLESPEWPSCAPDPRPRHALQAAGGAWKVGGLTFGVGAWWPPSTQHLLDRLWWPQEGAGATMFGGYGGLVVGNPRSRVTFTGCRWRHGATQNSAGMAARATDVLTMHAAWGITLHGPQGTPWGQMLNGQEGRPYHCPGGEVRGLCPLGVRCACSHHHPS